jgi:hypothetical protein
MNPPDELADALDPAHLTGVPKPVLAARRAYLALRSVSFPQADHVAAAHVEAVGALLGEAAVHDVHPERIDVTALTAARVRQQEGDDRRQVLVDASRLAGPRFAKTVADYKAELIDAIRRQHRARLEELADLVLADDDEAGQVVAAASAAERLRHLVQLIDGVRVADSWWSWTSTNLVYDDAIVHAPSRPGPGLWCRHLGQCGSPGFYLALYRSGVPVTDMWAPTSQELDQLADELHQARRHERALEHARR